MTGIFMSFTGVSPGLRRLHVPISDGEASDSHILHILRMREYAHSQYPFTMTIYRDPSQLAHPVKVMTGLTSPYGIAFNSHGEMVVSECFEHQMAVFDIRGLRIGTFGSDQMVFPKGVAVDDMDNVYVNSEHKLQKFSSSGELIKCVGQWGRNDREFNEPCGLALYNNQVYVCDSLNHRIQVYDMDLNFVQSIGSEGQESGKLCSPEDIKFDPSGNMYIAEFGNSRVQVLDNSGHFIKVFGEEGDDLSCLHLVDEYVYISAHGRQCIVVYETSGQFVTSFGVQGREEGEFMFPASITSCPNGFIYVCDCSNDRIQIF